MTKNRRDAFCILSVAWGVFLVCGMLQLAGCAVGGPDPAAERAEAARVQAEAERAGVALEATRQAVAFQAEREALDLERAALDLERDTRRQAAMDPFLAMLPWAILGGGVLACGLLAWYLLPIFVARYGLVTRRAEDGESVLLLGKSRFALPLRLAGPYADLSKGAERSPMLAASAEAQERATMRAQTANLALASQAAATVEARTKRAGDVNLVLPPERRERAAPALAAAPSPVRVLQEPTPTVAGWIEDVKNPLLLEVTDDD